MTQRTDLLESLPEEVKLLLRLEALKDIERHNPLSTGTRRERVAEHSWHLALAVSLLADFSEEPIDVGKAVYLATVHDVAEAFVGDTFAYGADVVGQHDRERGAMDALQSSSTTLAVRQLCAAWLEYEDQTSPEARFVKAMDAFLPILLNYSNIDESSWVKDDVRVEQVRNRLNRVRSVMGQLADLNDAMLDDAHQHGQLS